MFTATKTAFTTAVPFPLMPMRCIRGKGTAVVNAVFDSRALSSYADALYFLARKMYFEISFAYGREVMGKFPDSIEKRLEFLKKAEVFQERNKKREKVGVLERLELLREAKSD